MKTRMTLPNRWTLATYAGALALSTAAWLTIDISDAAACDGPPPAPDCSATVVCSLGVDGTLVGGGAGDITNDLHAAVSLVVTGNDVRCKSQTAQAAINLNAECFSPYEENMMTPGGSGNLNAMLVQGLNKLRVPLKFTGSTERICFVDGKVNVTLSSGQVFQGVCKRQNACIASPSPNDPTKPAVNLYTTQPGIQTTAPGASHSTVYRLENNTNEQIFSNLSVTQKNAVEEVQGNALPAPNPDPAVVCPATPPAAEIDKDCSMEGINQVCGCDNATYANACELAKYGVAKLDDGACKPPAIAASPFLLSHPGGDVMPIKIVDADAPDTCVALPENPSLSTESEISRMVPQVNAGQFKDFKLMRAAWSRCGDGSCSSATLYAISSGLGSGKSYVSCAGGPIVVDNSTPDTSQCQTSGTVPTTTPYTVPDTDQDGLDDDTEIQYGTNDMMLDTDGDTIPDGQEILNGTDPTLSDTDGDGLSDSDEIAIYHTNPILADSDNDGVRDDVEIQNGTNPFASDSDGDGITDATEIQNGTNPNLIDTDGDGLSDLTEINLGTNPNLADSDNDGVSDGIENRFGLDPLNGAIPADVTPYLDNDADGLTNTEEITLGTNPDLADSDMDGLSDGAEALIYNSNPALNDTDGDGLLDGAEVLTHHTNPNLRDTDGDGLSDGLEINTYLTNPLFGDTDGDGLLDGKEIEVYGTDPLNRDTDGSGASDADEIANGYNPNDPTDDQQLIGSLNTRAGIVLGSKDAQLNTVIFKDLTTLGVGIKRHYTLVQSLTEQVSRIQERLEVDSTNVTPGQKVAVSVNFNTFLQDDQSPYSINKLTMGHKTQNDQHDGKDFTGLGDIEITSAPYTIFEVMYKGSVWAKNPTTGIFERLAIEGITFDVVDSKFNVKFSFVAPSFELGSVYLMHDVNGFERKDFETTCNDGMDDDNDGKTDCSDSDCSSDPACATDREICGDGIDNDNNGKTDCSDSMCAFTPECRDQNPKEFCSNGIDDNGDGKTDCDDAQCTNDAACQELPTPPGKSNNADADAEGCSCSSVETPANRTPFALLVASLLGFIGLSRRRRD